MLRGVGLYLAVVQLLFALGWIVYAIYLPSWRSRSGSSASGAGSWPPTGHLHRHRPRRSACGATRQRVLGRVGKAVLAPTLVSSLAFLLLPWLAPSGWPLVFVVVTALWAVTSSALRRRR
ncbi:MAG: hypothetical protein U1F67_17500 [Rubrivivax sp.]